MRQFQAFVRSLIIPGSVGVAVFCNAAQSSETGLPPLKGEVKQVQDTTPPPTTPQQPTAPIQPTAPVQPTAPQTTGAGGTGGVTAGDVPSLFGKAGGAPAAGGAAQGGGAPTGASQFSAPSAAPSPTAANAAATPAASSVSGAQALPRASTDVGDLLGRSPSATGVNTQRRNPVVTDPRVRGYHVGQLFTTADGAFYSPARQDLDTLVSKIDSNLIRNVVVVKGPYSVRYGPGFSFLDIETLGSPRYDQFEAHGSTSLLYKTNGDQWRGRQSVWGGNHEMGFRLGYDLGAGSDFRNGAGERVNSSYNVQNIDFAYGFDLSQNASFEFRYLRQDQHDVEFPGQFFDISRGLTDAFTTRFTLKDQEYFDKWTVEAWYNATRFEGNNLGGDKQALLQRLVNAQPRILDLRFPGVTDGNVESPGYRTAFTWGRDGDAQLTVGSDLRYLSQRLIETDFIVGRPFNFSIPRSSWSDPGFFADTTLPWGDRLTVKAGVRFDYVDTKVQSDKVVSVVPQEVPPTFGPNRRFDLWGAYLSADYKLNDAWTANLGYGRAQRAPTLTELYAKGPFLAVVQNGLVGALGNAGGAVGEPRLAPEELRQLDIGLRAEYERVRFGASGFYAWVHNYITFAVQDELAFDRNRGSQLRTYKFANTDQATLSGFESYGEWDATEWLTPFFVMDFVEGRDHTRNLRNTSTVVTAANGTRVTGPRVGLSPGSFEPKEPLPGIPPYEARLGFRLHEPGKNPRWGVEFLARYAAPQDRVAMSLFEERTPGFTVFNLRGFWQATEGLLLTSGVENIGDRAYREHLDLRTFGTILQPGVNFYFGAQMTY